ncbi:hypothetical protein BC936DRAFT_141543 [Jimgerdemannia flammicorona]|uniref:ATP-dependent RNA helicase n=1 Tax=Jimgerdemannia flammicorona TaxID=994334 RepID=A0A433DFZ0_9FUNG|nr:hypothetical protein BC936DRAFT_141543 [Jimgerdemannia flammicorona]
MPPKPRKNKRQAESDELSALEQRSKDPVRSSYHTPHPSHYTFRTSPYLIAIDFQDAFATATLFSELPLSIRTQEGLKRANFIELTDIQRKAIPLALAGRDILGAAKTGSGKTLAFLVPFLVVNGRQSASYTGKTSQILELLYRAKWSQFDGLGALVISPTRELAVQIFEVLKKIGRQHLLSAGLIIGGKDLIIEQERVNRMNILVCTPGRLLQHMDQTVGFDCGNLQLLVLDEADRILDMGFEKTLNAIIDNLSKQRQTLLFSATQTKSVRDLGRLSLKNPEYVAVHEKSEFSTPQKLAQHYLVCDLPQKLDVLFSFIKTHLTCKAIVFLSACKQVRFVFEAFCRLHPGVPLLHLHGKQKQTKRVEIFAKFVSMKSAFLFATDIAARGLDFPAVDWVLQLDCPEDADTYIHRVGRTARFDAAGQALLFLLPSEEEKMLELLKTKKIPVEKIKVRQSKQQNVQKQLQSLCFQDPEIKYLGQKKDKSVFKVHELPTEEYATALGLPGTPKIKFITKSHAKNATRQVPKEVEELDSSEEVESEVEERRLMRKKNEINTESSTDDSESEGKGKGKRQLKKNYASKPHEDDDVEEEKKSKVVKPKTKVDRMFNRKNQDILSVHYGRLIDREGDKIVANEDDDEDNFITLKRAMLPMSKRQLNKTKKERIKDLPKGERIVFDDEGRVSAWQFSYVRINIPSVKEEKPQCQTTNQDEKDFLKAGDTKTQIRRFLQESSEAMTTADATDKEVAKEKRRQKKAERKAKAREMEGVDPSETYSENEENAATIQFSDGEPEEKPISKTKRWFQNDEEDEAKTRKKKRVLEIEQPQTLEDQEALALRLLGSL